MKKYKNIIFDCDGTLIDSFRATSTAFQRFTNHMLGRSLSTNELDEIFHKTVEGCFDILGIEHSKDNLIILNRYFEEESRDIKFYDGMEGVLRNLKERNIVMGLASNRTRFELLYAMKEHGISEYIDEYVSKDDVAKAKPAGDMLLYFIEKHKLLKDETIYLGNAISDHLSALEAGIDYAYCMWGTNNTIDEPHIKLGEVKEIMNLI